MQKHLLELVCVPAIRLFQRYKAMNANTVTASNGPTLKYHCTVILAEKNKQTNKKQKQKTRRYLVTMGQLKTKDPKENNVAFCCGLIVLKTVFN